VPLIKRDEATLIPVVYASLSFPEASRDEAVYFSGTLTLMAPPSSPSFAPSFL